MGEANLQVVAGGSVWGAGRDQLFVLLDNAYMTKIEFLRAFVIEDNLDLIPGTRDC